MCSRLNLGLKHVRSMSTISWAYIHLGLGGQFDPPIKMSHATRDISHPSHHTSTPPITPTIARRLVLATVLPQILPSIGLASLEPVFSHLHFLDMDASKLVVRL